jgi:hypothetical protein
MIEPPWMDTAQATGVRAASDPPIVQWPMSDPADFSQLDGRLFC